MRFVFFTTAFILSSLPAVADEQYMSVDEYNHVRPGLLLIQEKEKTEETGQKLPEKPSAYTTSGGVSTYAMTFEDVQRVYREGKYEIAGEQLLNLADTGLPEAEELLGLMYKNGQGFQKDPRKAFLWLSKAAEDNRALAQHHLGSMYFEGEGVPADSVKALMWLTIATVHYAKGTPERERATIDRDNLAKQVSRRERDSAQELARDWLDKKGERKLLDSQ